MENLVSAGSNANTLLLVDDDVVLCDVLSQALERRGFIVSVAHSAEEALPMAGLAPPRYAVLDLKMNGSSGLMLVDALHRANPEARIVVLTGYASAETAAEVIRLGAAQCLFKSASTDAILSALRHRPGSQVIN
ncbi:MAG: response regulator [Sideroxydans sp.]|nr:response regulator [Sideroxydans sp.]